MKSHSGFWYTVATILIVLISFRGYAAIFYPALNSDNAITILMIHYFELPSDLYFWGQDRMGSLIPLLAQIFYRSTGMSAAAAESLTHYLVLVTGFLAFASLLKSQFYKLIFAMAWFLPPMRMIDVTQFAFGLHYSFIAIACYIVKKQAALDPENNPLKYHLYAILLVVVVITGIWVNDMAVISFFVLGLSYTVHRCMSGKPLNGLQRRVSIFYFATGTLLGYILLRFAKASTGLRADYSVFGNVSEILANCSKFILSVAEFFTFSAGEPVTSVYAYLLLILFTGMFLVRVNIKKGLRSNPWILFFIVDAIVVLVIILVSHWTFINDLPRRYFTCTYVSTALAILLVLDTSGITIAKRKFLNGLLLLTVVTGAISTPYNLLHGFPKTLKSKIDIVSEFESLGKCGIIAGYWNAYIIGCANPELLIATTHDKDVSRNSMLTEKVFLQDNIFIVRDMWLEAFPDTLRQYGRVLKRAGNEFYLGDCFVCKYKLVTTKTY